MIKCFYCNNDIDEGEVTREHVPPASFFLPGCGNLMTISCCKPCNSGKSKDDEYVRQIFLISELAEFRPEFSDLVQTAMRIFEKPNKIGFRKMIENTSFVVPRYDGIDKDALEIDNLRLNRWIELTAFGILCFKGIDVRSRKDRARTLYLNSVYESGEVFRDLVRMAIKCTRDIPGEMIGIGEFQFWINSSKESLMLIQCYYKEHYFITIFPYGL